MILFLGSLADATFLYTIEAALTRRMPYDVVDLAHVALAGGATICANADDRSVIRVAGREYALGAYGSVYARLTDVSAAAPTALAASRYRALYVSLARLLGRTPLRAINPPGADLSNLSKPFHAHFVSRVAGWSTPPTIVSNDPSALRAFVADCPAGVIVKGISSRKTWVRMYRPDVDDARLREVRGQPVMLQSYVAGFDVRVHCVGAFVIAERIDCEDTDYRRSGSARHTPWEVPAPIRSGIAALQRKTALPMMGIDFRVTPGGDWLFLEANPMPAYQGYDRRCRGAISAAVIDWLR